MAPALYVRGLAPDVREWLDGEARRLGISTAALARLIITAAKDRADIEHRRMATARIVQ